MTVFARHATHERRLVRADASDELVRSLGHLQRACSCTGSDRRRSRPARPSGSSSISRSPCTRRSRLASCIDSCAAARARRQAEGVTSGAPAATDRGLRSTFQPTLAHLVIRQLVSIAPGRAQPTAARPSRGLTLIAAPGCDHRSLMAPTMWMEGLGSRPASPAASGGTHAARAPSTARSASRAVSVRGGADARSCQGGTKLSLPFAHPCLRGHPALCRQGSAGQAPRCRRRHTGLPPSSEDTRLMGVASSQPSASATWVACSTAAGFRRSRPS